MTYDIKIEHCDVTVSDERTNVPGIRVFVTEPDGRRVHGTIIPPEGDSMDCWVERSLLDLPRSLLLELGDDASEPRTPEGVYSGEWV